MDKFTVDEAEFRSVYFVWLTAVRAMSAACKLCNLMGGNYAAKLTLDRFMPFTIKGLGLPGGD